MSVKCKIRVDDSCVSSVVALKCSLVYKQHQVAVCCYVALSIFHSLSFCVFYYSKICVVHEFSSNC